MAALTLVSSQGVPATLVLSNTTCMLGITGVAHQTQLETPSFICDYCILPFPYVANFHVFYTPCEFSALTETKCFIYRKQILIFPCQPCSAYKYQITIPLNWARLGYLILKIAI